MDVVESRGTQKRQKNKGIRRSFDANFKRMVIKYVKENSSPAAQKKFGISEKNVRDWLKSEKRLKNACSQRKSFRGPKTGKYSEVEKLVVDYVHEKRN